LILKCFAAHPEYLWITLLKTCHQGPEALENQGFAQIAHQMGIVNYFNEIKDLAFCKHRLLIRLAGEFKKRARPKFVHKSSEQADFFHKKSGSLGRFCANHARF
jgi:hypothetical protein